MLLALFFWKVDQVPLLTAHTSYMERIAGGGRPQRPPPAFFCMVLLIAISSTKFQLISFFLRGATMKQVLLITLQYLQ